jgi:hypothetical protein
MEFRVHLQGLHGFSFTQPMGLTQLPAGLDYRATIAGREIPPERIGLDGTYDHAGLSKRVGNLLANEFSTIADQVRVSQRGQVVILVVKPVLSEELMFSIVEKILQMEGAASVEINGVRHLGRGRGGRGNGYFIE